MTQQTYKLNAEDRQSESTAQTRVHDHRRPPRSRFTAWLKKQLFKQLHGIKNAHLIIMEGEQRHHFGEELSDLQVSIVVHDDAFYSALALQGSVGAAESYSRGEWDCEELTRLIRVFVRNRDWLDSIENGSARLKNMLLKIGHYFNKNSQRGSEKNIAEHYDLGNDLFRLFLDERMMYSSAVYQRAEDDLETAAERKLKIICEKLQLNDRDHVIEIGTGWGGFAVYAAKNYGCRVTTTTISEQQYQYAKNLVEQAGLANQITVLKKDYRELTGRFDKLVSIEMVEAVGHQYLATYLEQCDALLNEEGLALIQAITIEDSRYHQALKSVDFIKKHIFPGSFIPSISTLVATAGNHTRLKLINLEDIGDSYARTLADWRRRFNQQTGVLENLGYDREFRRMWRFYFCYCEGGFIERAISDVHLLLAKPGNQRPMWRKSFV